MLPAEFAILPQLLGGRDVTLDAEVVTLDASGRPSFALLRRRMTVRSPTAGLLRQVPASLYVFDVLHLDGRATTEPYRRRRELLDDLALHATAVSAPPCFPDILAADDRDGRLPYVGMDRFCEQP